MNGTGGGGLPCNTIKIKSFAGNYPTPVLVEGDGKPIRQTQIESKTNIDGETASHPRRKEVDYFIANSIRKYHENSFRKTLVSDNLNKSKLVSGKKDSKGIKTLRQTEDDLLISKQTRRIFAIYKKLLANLNQGNSEFTELINEIQFGVNNNEHTEIAYSIRSLLKSLRAHYRHKKNIVKQLPNLCAYHSHNQRLEKAKQEVSNILKKLDETFEVKNFVRLVMDIPRCFWTEVKIVEGENWLGGIEMLRPLLIPEKVSPIHHPKKLVHIQAIQPRFPYCHGTPKPHNSYVESQTT